MLTRIKKIRILERCIYIMGYALILLLMSMIFKNTISIDNSYLGLWGILISIVIYILNKTIKPIIVTLTIPITALTLGIFYPFINLFILKLVDVIFGNHLTIKGIILPLFIAILISIMNFLMDEIVIKPILKKGK
jgi:putative membrane protein